MQEAGARRKQHKRSGQRTGIYKTDGAIERLEDAGYSVVIKSPWHLHVTRRGEDEDEDLLVNVWPTANKAMIEYGGGATVYTDLMKTVDMMFGRSKESYKDYLYRIWQESITPEMRAAEKLWQEGLEKIYALIKNEKAHHL